MSRLTVEIDDNGERVNTRVMLDGEPIGIMLGLTVIATANDVLAISATFADTPESLDSARKLAEFPFVKVQVELMSKAVLATVDKLSMCKECNKVTVGREELCEECRTLLEQDDAVREEEHIAAKVAEEELRLAEEETITDGKVP